MVFDSDPVSSDLSRAKHFTDLPLSDWRSLPVDPPTINPNLQKDPRAVSAALLASTGAAKEQRKLATRPLYVQPRGKLYSDQVITDEKKWAESIVALTHCLNRLQKLSQVFSSWRVKAQMGASVAGSGAPGSSGIAGASDSHQRRKASTVFSPGQGLLGEVHNNIVLPAVAEIERNVAAQGQPFPLSALAEPSYLTELLQLIFPALYMHFNAFMLMIQTMRTIKQRTPEVSFEFLDVLNEEYVWEYIQEEVRSVLSAHLASSGGAGGGAPGDARSNATFDANQVDLNAVMGKRRSHAFFGSSSSGGGGGSSNSTVSSAPGTGGSDTGGALETQQQASSSSTDGEPPNNAFFSFSKTSHSLSVNSYLRENRLNLPFDLPANHGILNEGSGDVTDSSSRRLQVGERGGGFVGNYPLVCRPAYSNVRIVYSLVIDFTKTIEEQPSSASRYLSHVLDNSTTSVARNSISVARNSRTKSSATSSSSSLAMGLKGALVALGASKFVEKGLVIHCSLRSFLVDFIERLYLPETQLDMRQRLMQILSAPDFLTNTVDQQSKRELGMNKPILTASSDKVARFNM